MRTLFLSSLLALASGVVAQPVLEWKPVGTKPNDSELAYVVGPDGELIFGGIGPPTADGEYLEGTWRLPQPAGSEQVWEHVGPRPRSGTLWVFSLGRDTLLAQAHAGLYRSTDGGQTWELRGNSPTLTARQVLEIPAGPYAGRVVVTTSNRNASFTDDRGGSWRYATGDDNDVDSVHVDRATVVTSGPHTGRVLGVGLNGITFSDDGGETWQKTADEWAYFQQSVGCIATLRGQAPGGGDRLLAVVNDIRIPTDSIYVTTSDDGGDTWQRGQGLFPDSFRTCTEAVDLGGGRAVAIMKRGPIWGTEDGGETWTVWTEQFLGIPEESDRARWAFVGPGGHLYVGIYRNGFHSAFDMRTVDPVVAVASEPQPPEASGAILRVTPNPASGAAQIRLTLATPEAEVRVSVFDARGREVTQIASGARGSGESVFAVDTAVWAPGVYVVRAEIGDEIVSARFTVAR